MLRTAAAAAPRPQLTLSVGTSAQSAARPKLKLSLATAAAAAASPPLPSPLLSPRSPGSPLMPPASPTAINTALNRRGASTQHLQVPPAHSYGYSCGAYAYPNSSQAKSILKKRTTTTTSPSAPSTRKRAQINALPTAVHAITPIEDADYWYKPNRW